MDYENAFYGRQPSKSYIQGRLELFVEECLSVHPDLEMLEVRLYGGWKTNASFTPHASELLGYMEPINSELFPVISDGHRIQGSVQLAVSQYNLDIEWQNTLQEKGAKHFLKVKTDNGHICQNDPSQCPIHIIARATRGEEVPCPNDGCHTVDVSQLVRMEQKMVDSMMTCDILEYVHDDNYHVVEVVSDDIDLHPALALAGERYSSTKDVKLLLLVRNERNSNLYSQQLGPRHVTIRTWQ